MSTRSIAQATLRFACPVVLVGALVGSAAHARGAGERADAAAARVSDRILAALVEVNGVPGMGASVWREGRVVWSGAAGLRNVEERLPVNDRTVFRLASTSKILAVVAAARLKEQGRLDVDAPVRSIVGYLPDRWPAISTAQLAAHTSGLPHYQAVDESRGGRHFATMREAVAVFQDRDLLSAPGEAYQYSSWGFTLLSAVVEEAAGRPYLDYLTAEITPGLRIVADATDTADSNASRAYAFGEGGAVKRAEPHDYSYSLGGAGMGATAPGLAAFGGRLLSGKIVSRATLEWMLVPARLADGSEAKERDSTVGFGLRAGRDADGERIAHHAGVTTGARSALVLYPDRDLAVSVLSNAMWVSSIEQTAMMLAAPFKPADPNPVAVPCPTGAVAYDGEYDGKPVAGTASFAVEDGVCVGEIGVQNAFGAWLNSFPQKDAATLKVIGVDPSGGLARAALVTPVAVYDLRAGPAGHVAAINAARSFSMRFRQT